MIALWALVIALLALVIALWAVVARELVSLVLTSVIVVTKV